MLELRPNCELCDCDLPPDSGEARICSYECTFCARCVETELRNVCPNCGGGFAPRPIRPQNAWRTGTGLGHHPAGTTRRSVKYTEDQRRDLSHQVAGIPPQDR